MTWNESGASNAYLVAALAAGNFGVRRLSFVEAIDTAGMQKQSICRNE